MTLPTLPSKALPVPLTVIGFVSRSRSRGIEIDRSGEVTAVASQMLPLLFPSRRLSVIVIVALPGFVLFTVTTALRSEFPPPLRMVAGALGFQWRRFAAKAWAVLIALNLHGCSPW